jgi:DNA-binding sugar fermentation-stimulating protein
MSALLTIGPLYKTGIAKRPSMRIKSPYVADIILNGECELAHTASLGCNGYVDNGAAVYVLDTKKTENKCRYRVCLSEFSSGDNSVLVGTNPKYAEEMAEQMLLQNKLDILQNVRSYTREFSLCLPEYNLDSRFDFSGIDANGVPFIMEIKTVPLADYEDIAQKERAKKIKENTDVYHGIPFDNKVAYFPDGYRKKLSDPVSPRALKHVQELHRIKEISNVRCILCFIIQRDDVSSFSPSVVDPEYRCAVMNAISNGVEVVAAVVRWTISDDGVGNAVFVKTVPVV